MSVQATRLAAQQSYLGCFKPSGKPISITNKNDCSQYALNNGYPYFGLTGNACYPLNDTKDLIPNIVTLWSSSPNTTSSSNIAKVTSDGRIVIENNGTTIWQSGEPDPTCTSGGFINRDTVTASYGANCVGKPYGIDCGKIDDTKSYSANNIVGNLTDIVKKGITENASIATVNPLKSWTGKDPAHCCKKEVNYSYQCGAGPFKSGTIEGAKAVTLDCSKEVSQCNFVARLEENGELRLYRTGDNTTVIWSSGGTKVGVPTPQWIATLSRWERPEWKSGQTLTEGEWIGSINGTVRLIFENGTLKIQTVMPCSDNAAMQVYQFDQNGIDLLGQYAVNGQKVETDTYSKRYAMLPYVDVNGNDLRSLATASLSECKKECERDEKCGGFVWLKSSACFLKNRQVGLTSKRDGSVDATTGIRLKVPATCGEVQVKEMDTRSFKSQITDSKPLSECPPAPTLITAKERKEWDQLDQSLLHNATVMSTEIISKEGMINRGQSIERMLEDSKLKADSEYYSCLLWTIAALGMITLTIKVTK